MRCIIIDDEEYATKVIANHITQVEGMELTKVFHSGVEAFLSLQNFDFDVLFLDIQMPKMTGISLLKMLKNRPITVLTTAHRHYALEGFDLDVADYLLKPISFERFLQAVKKIKKLQSTVNTTGLASSDYIFVRVERAFVKIRLDEIRYVEALKNHVRFHLSNNVRHISLMSMNEAEKILSKGKFFRIHRSYIINGKHLTSLANNEVYIGDTLLPIGRSYKEAAKVIFEGLG